MTRLLLALAVAGALAAPAVARPAVRITSLRVVRADGHTPARAPYRRTARYRIEYRVGGPTPLTVTRAATIVAPDGRALVAIRPPASRNVEAGIYFATAPLGIGPGRPGTYALQYAITVQDRSGATARARIRRTLRFR